MVGPSAIGIGVGEAQFDGGDAEVGERFEDSLGRVQVGQAGRDEGQQALSCPWPPDPQMPGRSCWSCLLLSVAVTLPSTALSTHHRNAAGHTAARTACRASRTTITAGGRSIQPGRPLVELTLCERCPILVAARCYAFSVRGEAARPNPVRAVSRGGIRSAFGDTEDGIRHALTAPRWMLVPANARHVRRQ